MAQIENKIKERNFAGYAVSYRRLIQDLYKYKNKRLNLTNVGGITWAIP
jgi:hypothetical protein